MKYEGLLTFEEAELNVREGYAYPFVIYDVNGFASLVTLLRASRSVMRWKFIDADDYIHPDNMTSYQGLAPTLGNHLPMSTVREDGREIILERSSGNVICAYCVQDRYVFKDQDGHYCALQAFIGWYPVVNQV